MTDPKRGRGRPPGATSAAILSAIESSPDATDLEIAAALGISRQHVGAIRATRYGPRPKKVAKTRKVTIRLDAAEWDLLRPGEDMSGRVRNALAHVERLRAALARACLEFVHASGVENLSRANAERLVDWLQLVARADLGELTTLDEVTETMARLQSVVLDR